MGFSDKLFYNRQEEKKTATVSSQDKRDDEEILDDLLADYIELKKSKLLQMRKGEITREEFMSDVRQHVTRYFRISGERMDTILTRFEQFIYSYDKLTPLMNKPEVSDIICESYNNIWYKANGIRIKADIKFRSQKEFQNFIECIATRNKARLNNLNALQRFTDHTSSEDYIYRFSVITPLVTTYNKYYMEIRKHAKDFPEIKDLIRVGMMSPKVADMLIERFQTGSTLIVGAPASGKTHLLNALKETLPHEMTVYISQQSDELLTKKHPLTFFLHPFTGNGESAVNYDLDNLTDNALTFDIDFIVIGEVKGKEAMQLLYASDNGMLSAGTMHSPSARKAATRFVNMAMRSGTGFSRDELMEYISVFNTIVFMKKYKVQEVYEVKGFDWESKTMQYELLYERKDEPWEL